MRLKLTLPEAWPKDEPSPSRIQAELPHGASLEAALSLGAPIDPAGWARGAVLGTVPGDAEAIFIEPSLSERETRGGWPFLLLTAELRELPPEESAEPGPLLGYHVGAFFVFLAYAAEVHLRFPDRAAYQALEAPLRKLLLSATVEWPDGTAATLATLCT